MHIHQFLRIALLSATGLAPWVAQAAPAPYFLWMSRIDGSRVCAQVSLGEGWQKMGGPYADSLCRKPA